MIDKRGFRKNIGIILTNSTGQVFWGKRIGQDAWQFPQGGMIEHESIEEALFRELEEEIGLQAADVKILGHTKHWLSYKLPKHLIRRHRKPVCIGQRQKWYLLRLISNDRKIQLDQSTSPEFDSWCWVDYWHPIKEVIFFKRHVYRRALKELSRFNKNK